MTDPVKKSAYMNNGLIPMLNLFKNYRDQIFAIEMFNEPEWMISGTGAKDVNRHMYLGNAQAFIKEANSHIRDAGFYATIGSACLKWSCT